MCKPAANQAMSACCLLQTPEMVHVISNVTHVADEAAPGMLAEADTMTPASATTLVESTPASARPSAADTVLPLKVKLAVYACMDDKLTMSNCATPDACAGEGQEPDQAIPEMVLHSYLSSTVAPMSVSQKWTCCVACYDQKQLCNQLRQ